MSRSGRPSNRGSDTQPGGGEIDLRQEPSFCRPMFSAEQGSGPIGNQMAEFSPSRSCPPLNHIIILLSLAHRARSGSFLHRSKSRDQDVS
jgi:hypothetical protein